MSQKHNLDALQAEAKEVANQTGDVNLVADVDQLLHSGDGLEELFASEAANPTKRIREEWERLADAARKVINDLKAEYRRRSDNVKETRRRLTTRIAQVTPSPPPTSPAPTQQGEDLATIAKRLTRLIADATEHQTLALAESVLRNLKSEVRNRTAKLQRALLFMRLLRTGITIVRLLAATIWFVILSAILLWLHQPFEHVAERFSFAADKWHVALPSFLLLLLIVLFCESIRKYLFEPSVELWWTKWEQSQTKHETAKLLELVARTRIEVARVNAA